MSNSDALRKCWSRLSFNAQTVFRVLYETQDYVPREDLAKHLYNDDLEKILGWIGRAIREGGGGTSSYYKFIDWDSGGYRLRDHFRPVVGELLGHHEKEKTVLLDTLWTMKELLDSLERRVDDIPIDERFVDSQNIRMRQQRLESLLQELLKHSDA